MWKNFYVVDLILYGFGLLCCVVRLVCVVIFFGGCLLDLC
jgi:hypothetical protein